MSVQLVAVIVDRQDPEQLAAFWAQSQDPDSLDNPDTWTVLTDPEGNEFFVTSTATLSGWA
jgi:hypothetical protein